VRINYTPMSLPMTLVFQLEVAYANTRVRST
jgi:hypothetical protein